MDVKKIIAAALWALGLYLSGLIIPLLGEVVGPFAPVPLIILYVRSGRHDGLSAIGLSTAVIFMLAGGQTAFILFLGLGLMAIGTAEGMLKRSKPENTILLAGLLPVALFLLVAASVFLKSGTNPVTALEGFFRLVINEGVKFYTALGLKEAAEAIKAISDPFIYYIVRLFPSIIIVSAVVQAALCYGLARWLIMRREGPASGPAQTSFAGWHAPDAWVWGLISALALMVMPSHTVRLAGLNLIVLFFVLYTMQGMALLEYFLKRVSIPALARGFILALVLPLLLVFVTALGVVDIWADFRKVRAGEQGK
ncbi:MAG TPA: DUF2232 domain-containing protein [Nitrospirota bacterium]|nr:DUF2232 domain-containing protein [Nitrospirota bacterium]